jgi:catechol 2,3-dioxygenase-like lactoylglutathione lyase family enzyme
VTGVGARRLHHFNYRAPPELIERLRDFYVDVIGLQAGPMPGAPSFVAYWLYLGGTPVVHLNGGLLERSAGEATPRTTGWVDHIAFTCDDHAGARMHLDALGIDYVSNEIPSAGLKQLFLTDPAGLKVELNFFSENDCA